MRIIDICPICDGNQFNTYLKCEDHTVSHEIFNIVQCARCNFLITSPSPDPDKLDQYYLSEQYISHAVSHRTLQEKLYKHARSYTLSWKLKLINHHRPQSRIPTLMDFGCGTGQFLRKSQQAGWKITGVEPSTPAREEANRLTNATITASIDSNSGQLNDVITLWHVLEHIPNLNDTISTLKKLLQPAGTLFIAVPNPESWDAQQYSRFWAGYDVPRHLWHFTQRNMTALLKKHQLKLLNTIPMKLDAFYVSLLSEKYQHHSLPYTFAKASINGLRSNFHARRENQYSSLIYLAQQ